LTCDSHNLDATLIEYARAPLTWLPSFPKQNGVAIPLKVAVPSEIRLAHN
jgi:hypothetical protein